MGKSQNGAKDGYGQETPTEIGAIPKLLLMLGERSVWGPVATDPSPCLQGVAASEDALGVAFGRVWLEVVWKYPLQVPHMFGDEVKRGFTMKKLSMRTGSPLAVPLWLLYMMPNG